MSARPTEGLHREQLPNGVTLLVQRCRTAPAAALVTHVRAGFLDEPDEVAGISHVLEHMLFKGTPRLGPGELAQQTKALGGSLNAYTAYDRTVYYASVPSRHAYQASALQADQVRNPLFDADELRRELGVIIQEARRKLDTPGAVTGETLHELLYVRHRIRRWRIGHEAVLEQFTRDQVAAYHRSRYIPSRTIVAMVSDLDPSEALAVLAAQWGDWSLPSVTIPTGPTDSATAPGTARRLDGDVALADLAIGWRGVGPLDPMAPALGVAAAILTGGRGARLSRLLRETGRVASIGAAHYGTTDADGRTPVGVFTVGAECEPHRLRETLDETASTLRALREVGPTEEEVTRAQTLIRARMQRQFERFEARATALAAAEGLGDVTRLDRDEADLLAVTPAAVQDAAQRYLDPAVASAVAYLPTTSDRVFDDAMLHDAMQAPARAITPLALPATPPAARPTSPTARRRAREHGVLHVAHAGVDLLVAQHGDVPQVGLWLYRPRPRVADPMQAGLDALGMRALMRGTARLEAAQLAVAFESLGGVLSSSVGADTIGIGTTVLQEHLPVATRLLMETLQRPRLDDDGIRIERDLLLDDARAVADDMVRFPFQLVLGQAFGDIGYGAPAFGTPDSLRTFDAERVRAWHREFAERGPTTVVAVGAMDPEHLADLLLPELESLIGEAPTQDVRPHGTEQLQFGVRQATRERKQAALAMLFPGPSRQAPERYAAEVWASIAGGLGGRLFESLRSARSLAYTVMASSWQRLEAGALLTYIAMAPERLEEARDAMLEELAQFRDAPPTVEELHRATAMLAGQAEVARQSAAAVAGEIADAWLVGAGLIELADPGAPYRAVTADEVQAIAAAFEPARRCEGVVSPGGSE